jgi:hypothetical protein
MPCRAGVNCPDRACPIAKKQVTQTDNGSRYLEHSALKIKNRMCSQFSKDPRNYSKTKVISSIILAYGFSLDN